MAILSFNKFALILSKIGRSRTARLNMTAFWPNSRRHGINSASICTGPAAFELKFLCKVHGSP
jgi:hypothetical protein